MIKKAKTDKGLLLVTLFLASFGLLFLLSASTYESEKFAGSAHKLFLSQLFALFLGFIAFTFCFSTKLKYFRRLGDVLLCVSGVLLLLVNFSPLGVNAGGSERWLNLGPLSFQPSELAKLSVLLVMADVLSRSKWNSGRTWAALAICALIAFLVLIEPDLGSFIMILGICGFMIFIAGMSLPLVITLCVLGFGALALIIINNPYQQERFAAWLSPENNPTGSGYNLLQAYHAIAEGGFWGAGYGNSFYKLGYLPVSYADFIFPVICEEIGFLAPLLITGAFAYVIWRGSKVSMMANNNFARFLGLGIVFTIGVQAIFNLGGVTGLLPITGTPLPLISYGKSSIIILSCMFGLLANISKYRKIKAKKEEDGNEKL